MKMAMAWEWEWKEACTENDCHLWSVRKISIIFLSDLFPSHPKIRFPPSAIWGPINNGDFLSRNSRDGNQFQFPPFFLMGARFMCPY
jgi:hypothetical protein